MRWLMSGGDVATVRIFGVDREDDTSEVEVEEESVLT
jgi:hypothetical protein